MKENCHSMSAQFTEECFNNRKAPRALANHKTQM